MERTKPPKLSQQVKKRVNENTGKKEQKEYEGSDIFISTGSTLLDLAISGGRVRGGGIPAGILVEVFGPPSSGKTVLLSEIAGNIQSRGGSVMFHDPEGRLNKSFASIFGLDIDSMLYSMPDTVTEVFSLVRSWAPSQSGKVHGIFADSLAALSTDLEMEKNEGDKMGMRRAKEFSEELRKTCRVLTKNNYLMVVSNQIRENVDAVAYGEKYRTPGGRAVGFYSSLRLRFKLIEKVKREITFHEKKISQIVGVRSEVEVYKSSVWKPYGKAPLTILFEYGIDDIRENLQYLKKYYGLRKYGFMRDGELIGLSVSMNDSIKEVEDKNWENDVRMNVINLWEEINGKFSSIELSRKKRH